METNEQQCCLNNLKWSFNRNKVWVTDSQWRKTKVANLIGQEYIVNNPFYKHFRLSLRFCFVFDLAAIFVLSR